MTSAATAASAAPSPSSTTSPGSIPTSRSWTWTSPATASSILHHNVLNRITLEADDTGRVMQHLADLWGYDVLLKEIDTATGMVLKEHNAKPHLTA